MTAVNAGSVTIEEYADNDDDVDDDDDANDDDD